MTRLPPPGDEKRYVFCERPRCPWCGGDRLLAYRTDRHDKTIARHTRCKDCSAKFIIVWE